MTLTEDVSKAGVLQGFAAGICEASFGIAGKQAKPPPSGAWHSAATSEINARSHGLTAT